MRVWTLVYVPAVGFALSLIVIRIKRRYVEEVVLFRRFAARSRNNGTTKSVGEDKMPSENEIDLSIALRKIHELGMENGDLGYAYWYNVGQLLKRAGGMQAQLDSLSKELELCRARLRKED
jgi:hypothetical protein